MMDLILPGEAAGLVIAVLFSEWLLGGLWCLWMIFSLGVALYFTWRPAGRSLNPGILGVALGAAALVLAFLAASAVYYAGGCEQEHIKVPPTCHAMPERVSNTAYVVYYASLALGIGLLPPFLAIAGLLQGLTVRRRRRASTRA
ncbi:MAG: hypothetical protein AAF698_03135 [Pseudomonadota bacterium]